MKMFLSKLKKLWSKFLDFLRGLNESAEIPQTQIGRWHQLISSLIYDSSAFYESIEKRIKEEELPNTSVYRILLKDRGAFSDKRLFLRVVRGESIFDIYGGPYGPGNFFISYWHGWSRFLGLKGSFSRLLLITPLFGFFFEKYLEPGTYYHSDMTEMFQEKIHEIVMTTLSEVMGEHDLPALTSEEQIPRRKRLDSF